MSRAAKGRCSLRRGALGYHRPLARCLLRNRMRQLPQKQRIWSVNTGSALESCHDGLRLEAAFLLLRRYCRAVVDVGRLARFSQLWFTHSDQLLSSEEQPSELHSLMRTSFAVFGLNKKNHKEKSEILTNTNKYITSYKT